LVHGIRGIEGKKRLIKKRGNKTSHCFASSGDFSPRWRAIINVNPTTLGGKKEDTTKPPR